MNSQSTGSRNGDRHVDLKPGTLGRPPVTVIFLIDVEELGARGIDIGLLYVCIARGLVMVGELNDTLDRLTAEEFNGMLEQVIERDDCAASHGHDQAAMALSRIDSDS